MTTQDIVDLLNDAARCDRDAVQALIRNRVPCNEELADHPSITVDSDGGENRVGMLGIIEGIAAIHGEVIEAVYDDETLDLIGFRMRRRT